MSGSGATAAWGGPPASRFIVRSIESPRPMRIVSTDHKVIGLQYLFTSLVFLLVGFLFILLIRHQLAYPGDPLPLIGAWLPEAGAPGGVMQPDFYTQLVAMHGT